ncbi:MAG TPA: flagellar type III secretion system protein FlhB [Gemmatimonadaceae bacterium]|nr:flagellar type III secretion system protein FlhB [Gemmatimonadaceae bacterium]
MADTEAERTENATPRKRDDAREEGKIAKSQELTIAASLLGSAVVLSSVAPIAGHGLFEIMGHGLANVGNVALDGASATLLLRETAMKTFAAIAGLLVAMGVGTFAMAALQGRGVLSAKPIMPDFNRVNPLANAKNMFGMRAVIEILKSLSKVAIVGLAVYGSIKAALPDAIALSQESQLGLLYVVKHYSVRMLATAGGAYLALAAADYVWQWWQLEKSLRMTKEEVKQEMKQNDGDPHVKQRRRSIARQYARKQMMKDVPKADVVIVNPTHIAIAIKYDTSIAPAPIVLAIGMNKVAERIKEIAREAGVPMVENRPLARALLKTARVGTMIPYELYMAVAEVLAFVIRTRGKLGAARLSKLA